MQTMTCSCGESKPHRIAARRTADDRPVELWSTGTVTGAMGFGLDGVLFARPRSPESREVALTAGWLLMGEVECYDRDELPALYAACRKVAAKGGRPGDVRAAMAVEAAPRIPIRWEVLQADRDGKATCRVGHLPRLMFAGTAIWHERGFYEVMYEYTGAVVGSRSRSSWHGSGITFTSQRELLRFLASNRPVTVAESAQTA